MGETSLPFLGFKGITPDKVDKLLKKKP